MSKVKTVASYLIKITKLYVELATIGEEIMSEELIPIDFSGFSSSRQPFIQDVHARDKLPTFDKLWDIVASIEEETQHLALVSKKKNRRDWRLL